ncbi:TRAP-T family transporter, periplasmic substrate binding subunit [Pseudooceanicola batsensis HTCC2597]|uniref:TRAP-T family transporter, periplasmic substrate binding subunit n=1 Tax=Pseudooceanicola batsensis (strain ATCC BAA-863 / DSM 15984 / KCTC 12145 / HTCC2597) TaxID=252305 RepID=A3U0L2_PSEBH|nr:TAXI family TRAP transporter solute-binding subunit [Pseudooceanicola batsensis]EAQ02303.1 TRAP-T family transporter, periplasmic substrate binding subunit [Pseudooceanicola batsensis HTCC2597]
MIAKFTRRGALALAMAALPAMGMAQDVPKFFKIVSTSPGGLWHTFGTQLADKLGKAFPEMAVSHVPGGSNVNHKLVSSGDAQMGFSFSPTSIQAWNGEGSFDREWQDARVVGTFYPAYLHAVAREGAGIESMEDLQGKVVSPGKREWSTAAIAMQILEQFGINEDSLAENGGQMQYLGFGDVTNMMADRRLDAFMYYASAPSPLLLKLNEQPGIRIVPYTQDEVDRILPTLTPAGAYVEMTYPTDPYEGSAGGFPVPTMWSIFLVNKDVPDAVVYELTKILYEDADLKKFMGADPSLSVDHATTGLKDGVIPFHPGAQQYLEEQGAF